MHTCTSTAPTGTTQRLGTAWAMGRMAGAAVTTDGSIAEIQLGAALRSSGQPCAAACTQGVWQPSRFLAPAPMSITPFAPAKQPATPQLCLARQAIFDARGRVFGYELLY